MNTVSPIPPHAGRAIRNYQAREAWAKHHRKSHTTWAFYNSGKNLFTDPYHMPANTFYLVSWLWVPFNTHCLPNGFISAGPHRTLTFMDDQIRFQHLGHGTHCVAKIAIGSTHNGFEDVPEKTLSIPPLCILFVVVRYGHVIGYRLEFQPLPMRLLPVGGSYLTRVAQQFFRVV